MTTVPRPSSATHLLAPGAVLAVVIMMIVAVRMTGERLVILDWLAQDFEPGKRYSEKMVNLVLGRRHADTAALRAEMTASSGSRSRAA